MIDWHRTTLLVWLIGAVVIALVGMAVLDYSGDHDSHADADAQIGLLLLATLWPAAMALSAVCLPFFASYRAGRWWKRRRQQRGSALPAARAVESEKKS